MFCRSLPGLKRMVRPGGMRTSLPVRGLRPMPRLRGFTWNTPNPRSSIRSPRCMEVRIASNTASTATSALTLVMLAIFDTSLTMSTLIMLRVSRSLVNTIDCETYAVKAEAKLTTKIRAGPWPYALHSLTSHGQAYSVRRPRGAAQRRQVHTLQPHDREPPRHSQPDGRHDPRRAGPSG